VTGFKTRDDPPTTCTMTFFLGSKVYNISREEIKEILTDYILVIDWFLPS